MWCLDRTLDLEIDGAGSREETPGKPAVSMLVVVCVNLAVLTKGHAEESHRECQLVQGGTAMFLVDRESQIHLQALLRRFGVCSCPATARLASGSR